MLGGDRLDLRPRLERPLLLRPPLRVRNTALRRVVVEQPPGDRAVEDLPQRLRRLETMSLWDRQAPRVDVLRRQVCDALLAERSRRFAEQPAQLRDRHRLSLMELQIILDEFGERDGTAAAGADPI